MSEYCPSDNIFVFPSVQRTDKPESRNLSENNLTTMFRSLVSTDATYVISEGAVSNATKFEFVIDGYYFKLTPITTMSALFNALSSFGDSLSASITVNATTGSNFVELQGTDDDEEYTGVEFFGDGSGDLLLAVLNNATTWVVPQSSNRRYNGSSVYGVIDGNSPEVPPAS